MICFDCPTIYSSRGDWKKLKHTTYRAVTSLKETRQDIHHQRLKYNIDQDSATRIAYKTLENWYTQTWNETHQNNHKNYQHPTDKLSFKTPDKQFSPSCFHTISRFPNFHTYPYNCISTRKILYISCILTITPLHSYQQ